MDPRKTRNAEQTAQSYFTRTASAQENAKRAAKKERSAVDVKIAKLRELRLAKEADDRVEAEKATIAAPNAPAAKARRARPAKPVRVRFTF